MLQDIAPHRYDIGFQRRRPQTDDIVVVMGDVKTVLVHEGEAGRFPTIGEIAAVHPGIEADLVYLFSLDETAYFHSPITMDAPEGFGFRDVEFLREAQPSWLAFAGATAGHLGQWYRKNRFCGFCGAFMKPKTEERALHCDVCGLVIYPAIAPAVIVAVTDGERLLMTRYANRTTRRMALVAGFTEVGETLEDTVRREVMEEVGLRVKNIRYYKSQPWSFSGSLLVGYFADLDGSPEITLDTNELQEAVWVCRPDIAPVDTSIALTSEMIDVFRRGASV